MREEEAVHKAALLPAGEGKGRPKTAVDFDEPRILTAVVMLAFLLSLAVQVLHKSCTPEAYFCRQGKYIFSPHMNGTPR